MGDDDSGRGRGRGRGEGSGRGRGRGGDDLDEGLLTVHVALGLSILLLAVVRVLWRRATALPPWAETLTALERRLASLTERALYGLLFAIPASGLLLLLTGEDDVWLALHVTTHVTFFATLAVHVGLVVKHQVVDRDRLLSRML
jgi:cytochrome b561